MFDSSKILFRKMQLLDIDVCIQITIDSFGSDYPTEQFNTIREEFEAAFGEDKWSRPNFYVCVYNNEIIGMAGYVLSDTLIKMDTKEFDDDMFPEQCHCH